MFKKIILAAQPFLEFFKKNSIFIVAFIIGIIIIFPSLYFHYGEKGYRGIEYFGSDGEELYLSQIEEMYDGHYSMSNVYLVEGKNGPYVQQSFLPFIIMILGRLLLVTAPEINIITKFLFPFLLTLLVYLFFKTILKRKDVSILLAVFIMLGPATTLTFLNPGSWLPLIKNGNFTGADLQFLSYARSINPQASSFFFFGYLICIWKFLFDQNKRMYGYFSAALLGLSFYSYFFVFSLLFAFNGFLGLWFLVKKNWSQLKKIAVVTVGALAIGVPYFINTMSVIQSAEYAGVAHRLGVAEGHTFIFSRVWWGVLLITLLLYRKWDDLKIFILTFLAAAFMVTNQQLITGRTVPFPSHYHWYYIAPIGGAIILYLFFLQLEKIASRKIFLASVLFFIVTFLIIGTQFQLQSYDYQRDIFLEKQRYAPVVSWVENNLIKDSVVFANVDLSKILPAYTNKNVYRHNGEGDYLVGESRLEHSLFIYMFLNGVTRESVKTYLLDNRQNVGVWLFSQTYRVQKGCYGCFPDSVIENLVVRYENFLEQDFISELNKYQLDYFIWDKKENPSWKADRFFNEIVYQQGSIVIYKTR